MEKYQTYLLQYIRGKDILNRFYATNCQHKEKLFELIEISVQKKKNESLENIADSVEIQFLEHRFIALGGIKRVLKSYKGIVNNNRIYQIRVQ